MLLSSSGEILLQSDTYSLPFENGGWLPSSQGFLVSTQTQMLCSDVHGKIFSKKKFKSKDSIMTISLVENNTEAFVVQANGSISSLPLLLLTPLSFQNFEVKTDESDHVTITNISSGYSEKLDVQASQLSAIDCNFGHLVFITNSKLMIYDLDNLLTPGIQDFTGNAPLFLKITASGVMVCCPPQLFSIAFSGKTISVINLPVSLSTPGLSKSSMCLSAESIFISGNHNKTPPISSDLTLLRVLKFPPSTILLQSSDSPVVSRACTLLFFSSTSTLDFISFPQLRINQFLFLKMSLILRGILPNISSFSSVTQVSIFVILLIPTSWTQTLLN
jgi:hypothetical protein